jgi:Xaa-Pro aminopeptidase
LHAASSAGALSPGDLILCDVGGETPEGYTADITRTWPVSGEFSPTQRDIYVLVLAVQKAAVAGAVSGVNYAALHERAGRAFAEGLAELGILRGSSDELFESGAASLFFPHGLGHLLGLDVHDMEDLGDRAGYGSGAVRSLHPAFTALRLNRTLLPGMCVTIEPGFYQVPLLLERARADNAVRHLVNWDRLADFSDVRGIRIEDDVLITEREPEVLSRDAPKEISEVCAVVRSEGNASTSFSYRDL